MATYTLKPNAAGDLTNIPTQFPASDNHWDKVDEAVADEDTTYVQNDSAAPANYKRDLYNLEAIPVSAEAVSSIMIGVRVRKTGISTFSYYQIRGKTNGTEFTPGTGIPPTDQSWVTGQFSYGTNPVTGLAWTVDEINALQVGVSLYSDGTVFTRCTQVYVVVTVPSIFFPADPLTRVTAFVHRYDRYAGIYQLEMSLGDVTSVFAHSYELGARRATASKELVQETGLIFDMAEDERLLRGIPPELGETKVVDVNGQDVTKLWKDFWSANYQQVEKMVSDYFKRVTGGAGEKIK